MPVNAYLDNGFSFGAFVRQYPELRGGPRNVQTFNFVVGAAFVFDDRLFVHDARVGVESCVVSGVPSFKKRAEGRDHPAAGKHPHCGGDPEVRRDHA